MAMYVVHKLFIVWLQKLIRQEIFDNNVQTILNYKACIQNLRGIVSDMALREYKFKKYSKYIDEKYGENEIENIDKGCVICIQDFKPTDDIICLSCNHIYHFNCISGWFYNTPTCPMCRRYMTGVARIIDSEHNGQIIESHENDPLINTETNYSVLVDMRLRT